MLSKRLQIAMREAGVSQAELARACGVKPPSVNGWLSGKSKFLRGENLLAAAKALNVSQAWLATGNGPMHPQSGELSHIEHSGTLPSSPDPSGMANVIESVLKLSNLDLTALGGRAVVVAKIQLALEMQNGGTAKPELTIMDLTKPDPVIPGISAPEEHKKAS